MTKKEMLGLTLICLLTSRVEEAVIFGANAMS